MGISWSKRHRHHHVTHPPLPSSASSSDNISPPTPPPPPTPYPSSSPDSSRIQPLQPPPPPHLPPIPPVQSVPPPSYAFAANAPHPIPLPEQYPYHRLPLPPLPPPPPLPPFSYNSYTSNYPSYHSRPINNDGQYSNYRPIYFPQINGWGSSFPPLPPAPPPPPVPYVDHQSAKKIKNDVNVHKDTIRLYVDEQNKDSHLVSFVFDALVDGSVTIFYFAKEGPHCSFTPIYPEIVPVKIPFQKGLGQKFCQPSGTGVDLGFFSIEDLSKPFPNEDVYPLVVLAESYGPTMPLDGPTNPQLSAASHHAQISQAILEKKKDEDFHVKVIKQILWSDGVRYELREIFGISNSNETSISDMDLGKECVICMTDTKNTAVLPCRHLCMCSECAKELRLQSNKCPICRHPIEELLEIKVDEEIGA